MLHRKEEIESLSNSTESQIKIIRDSNNRLISERDNYINEINNLKLVISDQVRQLNSYNILKSLSSLSTIFTSNILEMSPREKDRIRFLMIFAVEELISTAERNGNLRSIE